MDRKTLVTIGIIILLIIAGIAYLLLASKQPDQSEQQIPEDSVKEETPGTNDKPRNMIGLAPGQYVDYSEDNLAASTGTRLLFFHAPWCPQCRALEASIKDATLPKDVTIFKVDYDTHQELRQKYGVTLQTTVVKIDGKGEKTESYVAYDEPTFASVKRELLE